MRDDAGLSAEERRGHTIKCGAAQERFDHGDVAIDADDYGVLLELSHGLHRPGDWRGVDRDWSQQRPDRANRDSVREPCISSVMASISMPRSMIFTTITGMRAASARTGARIILVALVGRA